MSVTNCEVTSNAPTELSSVVGSRQLLRNSAAAPVDEAWKRNRCAYFEKKLHMELYQRDKRNEERGDGRYTYVRVNSKRLHCSYDIPAEDCYRLLQRLRDLLAPGLRAQDEVGSREIDEKLRRKHLNVLYDWTSCSDFTAQAIPKIPTILWLDIDCVRCKNGGRSTGAGEKSTARHVKSSVVIDTVLSVVAEHRYRDGISTKCTDLNRLYVTRGRTCGMHLFFPQIVIEDEYRLQELLSEVSQRLRSVEATAAAAVDTGCSAMPLPLAREHSGLTRIVFQERDIIKRSHVLKPSLRDLASVTTFYNFVADRFDDGDDAVSSLVGSGITTTSSKTTTSRVVVVENTANLNSTTAVDSAELKTEITDLLSSLSPIKAAAAATTTTTTVAKEESEPSENNDDCVENVQKGDASDGSTGPSSDAVVIDNDKKDSESTTSSTNSSTHTAKSSSSKRELVQTNLRDLYAKIEKRKSTSSVTAPSSPKRPLLLQRETSPHDPQSIVIDDDEDEDCERAAVCGTKMETNTSDDEAASSFLCAGYLPRNDSALAAEISSSASSSSTAFGGLSSTVVPVSIVTDTTAVSSTISPQRTAAEDCCVSDETVPPDASVPVLHGNASVRRKGGDELLKITRARQEFENNMKLTLDAQENPTHETDIQFLLSTFNTELGFYTTLLKDTVPLMTEEKEFDGLRLKEGCSLHDRRESCPPAMFPEHMPFVLYTEDFVTEAEWVRVLIRYFDEYLNNAPFLLVMSYVLRKDENVTTRLSEGIRLRVLRHVQNCLSRFKYDAIALQRKNDTNRGVRASDKPKHPYEDKSTVVTGLIAVCSLAFEIKTPIFTDFSKVCRLLLVKNQQTLDSLNTSTMSTAGSSKYNGDDDESSGADEFTYCSVVTVEDDLVFDDSVSQAGKSETSDDKINSPDDGGKQRPVIVKCAASNIGNNHTILASLLRWNYTAFADHTLWCLFYYYYHVHTDALERITDETMHGGLMVTAVLQAFFECVTRNAPIDVRSVCNQVYVIEQSLRIGDDQLRGHGNEDERSLMPPPAATRSGGNNKRKTTPANDGCYPPFSPTREQKRQQFDARNENSKKAQRKVLQSRHCSQDDDDEHNKITTAGKVGNSRGGGGRDEERRRGSTDKDDAAGKSFYKTSFTEVLSMLIRFYLRPMAFDETTVVYAETGYDYSQNEFSSSFAKDKDMKRHVMDLFNRYTLKYSMPHGDLLMYNTDVMGTVHRRSSCTNNLVLNVFENMYGGCMSYLTRRYNNHLKLFNRFNGDAYRLVVECRHAMNGLVRSIEISYLNLILRQPVVPPVLEADITVRNMFMCEEELLKGAFVCLNAMDYVRAINMFTKHTRFSQKNCRIVESFLDRLATGADNNNPPFSHDAGTFNDKEESRTLFRTTYLFYMLYIFEVLYKIRHAYRRDGSYSVSVERLSWELDVRVLLKLFFGAREFKTPRGLSPEVVRLLDPPTGVDKNNTLLSDVTGVCPTGVEDDGDDDDAANYGFGNSNRVTAARCINTRPVISTALPDKMSRMVELFGKKGLAVMKSYAPLDCVGNDNNDRHQRLSANGSRVATDQEHENKSATIPTTCADEGSYESFDRVFLNMTQTQLEEALYSAAKWYDNCRIRVATVSTENTDEAEKGLDTCMDATSMDTFLRTQLRVHIDNNRLAHIERAVRRDKKDFHFCTQLPLRVKMMALVLATHSVKRLTTRVAEDFCRKEYRLERAGVLMMTGVEKKTSTTGEEYEAERDQSEERPDQEWTKTWHRLLCKRKPLIAYCRSLAESYFPNSYFAGLQPEDTYQALYNHMLAQPKYVTLHTLKNQPWAKDVCAALNYLLVINGYDPELVELCLRLFLGFEWPGQWAKRIFVWKSNSNAGKSFFFEHVLRKAFDQSTCINDPKGGKENAPEKSEYYKNFVLMINEFSTASACELKKLCSTSSYKFRMNFGNQMIQAFMVGKLVFNCNTLPATTDHATIQRVALVPLPFWFQKRQTVVESMLNWTRGQCPYNEYERNFKRNLSQILNTEERRFFLENRDTKNEDDLFNKPNEISLQLLAGLNDQHEVVKASMFQVQNKTSQVYMSSCPPINTIVSGIVTITKYFCRFRFFNNIKEPVDYSVLPTACNVAAREWQRISQPYFEWKDRCQVQKDSCVRTKVSVIHASLNHFAKNHSKTTSFFDLRQFFEWDFAEQKIPYYNAKEDEYNVRLENSQD